MALTADVQKLTVELGLVDKLSPAVQRIDRRLGAFSGAVNRNLGRAVDSAATFAARGLIGAFQGGIDSLRELDTVVAQTEAVIKSTGGTAGVTARQVRDLAEEYENLNAQFDDKAIQDAENRLLTFTNISEKAFKPALEAVLDYAQATGTDATAAAKLLGRALNDPIRGMTQLIRAGISLDKATQDQITTLAKQGDILGAQRVLLDELTKRYGRSFARAGQTAAGSQARLADKVEDVQKAFAQKLLPVVVKISDRISNYLARPETIAFFDKLGDTISGLLTDENLDALTSGIETAAKAVSMAIGAFNSLPPEIKALAIGAFAINKVTGGAVGGAAEAFGKLIGAGIQKIFAANVTVIGTNVTGAGAAGGVPAATGRVSEAVGAAGAIGGVVAVGVTLNQIAGGVTNALADAIGSNQTQRSILNAAGQNATYLQSQITLLSGLPNLPNQIQQTIDFLGGKVDIMGNKVATTTAQSVNAAKNAITSNERGEGAKHRAAVAQVVAKQQASINAFRAGERATLGLKATTASKLDAANARLTAIRNKRMSFTTHVTAVANVSVRNVNNTTKTYTSYGGSRTMNTAL